MEKEPRWGIRKRSSCVVRRVVQRVKEWRLCCERECRQRGARRPPAGTDRTRWRVSGQQCHSAQSAAATASCTCNQIPSAVLFMVIGRTGPIRVVFSHWAHRATSLARMVRKSRGRASAISSSECRALLQVSAWTVSGSPVRTNGVSVESSNIDARSSIESRIEVTSAVQQCISIKFTLPSHYHGRYKESILIVFNFWIIKNKN